MADRSRNRKSKADRSDEPGRASQPDRGRQPARPSQPGRSREPRSAPGDPSPQGARSPRTVGASTGTRKQIEDASRQSLIRLSRMPKLVVPLGTVLLVAVGLFAPLPIALPALALVFAFFAWIAYLSWPVVTTGGRVLRGVMLGLVIAMVASRLY